MWAAHTFIHRGAQSFHNAIIQAFYVMEKIYDG